MFWTLRLLLCLGLLSGCYNKQSQSENQQVQLEPVKTLVVKYESRASRKAFQDWLSAQAWEHRVVSIAGKQAEIELTASSLSSQQLETLRSQWQSEYTIERHADRLILICCTR